MNEFEQRDYKIFEMFKKDWAIVTAGTMEHHNGCTVSWGSMGTLWTRPGKSGSVITVYLYPTRYTREFLCENELFTVSFFSKEQKKALDIFGTMSGRDGNKADAAGLTPVVMGGSIGYEEAKMTFVCRKIYQHRMAEEDIAEDVRAYYAAHPAAYPVDENGDWHPHWIFMGEILEVVEKP